MADNFTPGLQEPINNQCGEKSIYSTGEDSAPLPQNIGHNYVTNQNYYYFQNNQIENPGYGNNNNEQTNYMNNNLNDNNNNNNETQQTNKALRKQLILGIILLICVIIDMSMQLIFKYVNCYAMGDDIIVLLIASITLIFVCKRKIAQNYCFITLIRFVSFIGFGFKAFAIIFINKENAKLYGLVFFIYFIILLVRLTTLLMIPN